jgi:Domain of unknown function (DUF4760)
MQQLRGEKHDDYYKLLREPNYLEDLGVLVRHQGIEFGVIQDSFGYLLVERWNRWKPFVVWLREEVKDETYFENFELLAVAIMRPPKPRARWQFPWSPRG